MSLEGPQLHYARVEGAVSSQIQAEDTLKKALELARELEELLEDTRSSAGVSSEDARAHSTRMARAFAASLVDELAALVRPVRHTGSS